MKTAMKTVLVGIAGYGGRAFGNYLMENMDPHLTLEAVIDPFASKSIHYEAFKAACPIFDNFDAFFAAGHQMEYAIITSPIHLHFEHCVTALEHGAHVYCEKPLVPTMDELNQLKAVLQQSGKTLSVGFQWCFSDVMQHLKQRVLSGALGKPKILKAVISWPRGDKYYHRNTWSGKIKTPNGQIINDSVLSNASSHHLQTMLYLLGEDMESSANLNDFAIETYRANDIESFDTCFYRGAAGDATLYLAASHAVSSELEEGMCFEFEHATVRIDEIKTEGDCVIIYKDGTKEHLGKALREGLNNRVRYSVEIALGMRDAICSVKTVTPITAFIDAVFQDLNTKNFPAALILRNPDLPQNYVKNLHKALLECYHSAELPSEKQYTWA